MFHILSVAAKWWSLNVTEIFCFVDANDINMVLLCHLSSEASRLWRQRSVIRMLIFYALHIFLERYQLIGAINVYHCHSGAIGL